MKLRYLLPAFVLVTVVLVTSAISQQPAENAPPVQPVAVGPLRPGDDPSERLALDQVLWNGAKIDSLKPFEGKSVVVFVYATWCPKCNQWSEELFRQLMLATKNRPVVILAINADEKDPTLKYVTQRNFGGPNIMHGYDPGMTQRLGFTSSLFQYVWIDPKGRVKETGHAGTKSGVAAAGAADAGGAAGMVDTPPTFTLAKKLHEATDLGTFKLIEPDLSPEATAILWPFELGEPLTTATLAKIRRVLKGEQKDHFEKTLGDYVGGQSETIKTLSEGGVPERLDAYAQAESFVKNFRAFPQAKQVREVLDTLKKDQAFKKELTAMRLYEKATAKSVPPQRRLGMLRNLAKQHKNTHYGTKAAGEVQ